MKIYRYPKREVWGEITSRPRLDLTKLNETVSAVLADIRQRGDEAVREYVADHAGKLMFHDIAVCATDVVCADVKRVMRILNPEVS